jgi:hypothetical protein
MLVRLCMRTVAEPVVMVGVGIATKFFCVH